MMRPNIVIAGSALQAIDVAKHHDLGKDFICPATPSMMSGFEEADIYFGGTWHDHPFIKDFMDIIAIKGFETKTIDESHNLIKQMKASQKRPENSNIPVEEKCTRCDEIYLKGELCPNECNKPPEPEEPDQVIQDLTVKA